MLCIKMENDIYMEREIIGIHLPMSLRLPVLLIFLCIIFTWIYLIPKIRCQHPPHNVKGF